MSGKKNKKRGVLPELQQHQQCAGYDQNQSQQGFFGKLFLEDRIGEAHRDQNAQFVNGNDHTGQPVLQSFVVAEPGGACSDSGKTDKQQFFFGNLPQFLSLSGDKNHKERKEKHHSRADHGTQIGFHPFNAELSENGGRSGEATSGALFFRLKPLFSRSSEKYLRQ